MKMFPCVKVSVLLAVMALSHSSSATVEKLSSCCKLVSTDPVKEKITGILPQRKNGECVDAYIVQTEKNLYCVFPGASWVRPHVQAFRQKQAKAKAQAPTKKSLLSILSTRAPPPSATSDTVTSSTVWSSDPTSIFSSSTPPPTSTSDLTSDPASSTTDMSSSGSYSLTSDLSSVTDDDVSSGELDFYV
ncbi:chemokine (C-C motif) ligand 34b, duplicate 4 [Periophthalmus magnuspinnatus]|uniref:chemokine (C-C motif) ligand 34b, duplicate 4 n=1 Tax=Periophthalmus magnuspinnatus TaxID=409849 RepID=UPI00145AB120|nr:chemokine (C-C motif) ligand 34b, duplicate 4 [Periophthalmus magnuspinnatus]